MQNLIKIFTFTPFYTQQAKNVVLTYAYKKWILKHLSYINVDNMNRMHTELHRTCQCLHANGEPFLKLSSSHSHSFPVVLIVWSANDNGRVLTSKASSNVTY